MKLWKQPSRSSVALRLGSCPDLFTTLGRHPSPLGSHALSKPRTWHSPGMTIFTQAKGGRWGAMRRSALLSVTSTPSSGRTIRAPHKSEGGQVA